MRYEPVVLSYYTAGTYYEKDAAKLKASCEEFGLEYRIEPIEPFGKWFEHACFKPQYILKHFLTLQRPVLWIDADAEVVKKPKIFGAINTDLAIRIYDEFPPNHPSYFSGGTIYFDYNVRTAELLQVWKKACDEAVGKCPPGSEVWDQMVLKAVVDPTISITPLPRGYAAIFDVPSDLQEPYIIHYQASRLYKKFIDKQVAPFSFLDSLSAEELRTLRPTF